jgi:hypothetical protein
VRLTPKQMNADEVSSGLAWGSRTKTEDERVLVSSLSDSLLDAVLSVEDGHRLRLRQGSLKDVFF